MKAMSFFRHAPGFGLVASLWFACASDGYAQTASSNTIPVVTVLATSPRATWAGDPGVFTLYRQGNSTPALNVYCCISGTASNGVDYESIGSFVPLASGVMSNTVVIHPIWRGQTNIETVVLDLCPSPLMTPVNYSVGSPSHAVVYIAPAGVTDLPPVVTIVSPTNGAIFQSPASISLIARATDPDGTVTNVEFFAGTTDLGPGLPVVLDPPGVGGVVGLVYFLNWTNVPPGAYPLTAVATDDNGASTVSAPVKITVLGTPTNLPPLVRITSPPNGAVFRAPVSIPLYAYAVDPDDAVAAVEFFADGASLGLGQPVTAVPPPLPPGNIQPPIVVVVPTNYWELVWTNAPLETNVAVTAKALDTAGASSISSPVHISILPSAPPPTNRPPLVSIVATDPVAIEGTNCWPWLGLASPVTTWSNWFSSSAVFQWRTNCGPKNASFSVFRCGATNEDLDVNYAIGGSATNGVDYVALPGTVRIAAGERQASIAVVPLDDGPPDFSSTVLLKIAPGTNYMIGYPAGAAAIILDSASPRACTGMVPGNLFSICAPGPDGAWFHIECSTDAIHWTALCTNQVVNGSINFVDPDAASQPTRFYRTVPEAGLTAP
jgi:hypothetical protein